MTPTKPSWARYRARNKDGYWYWYAYRPKPSTIGWVAAGIKARINDKRKLHENWPHTLIKVS